MTSGPYSPIGPYKGVPSDLLAGAALRANETYEASAAALARHAKALGDDVGGSAVIHQSIAKANAVWNDLKARSDGSYAYARSDFYTSLFPALLMGGMGIASTIAGLATGNQGLAAGGIFLLAPASILGLVYYLSFGGSARAAMLEIRKQGYLGDNLTIALRRVARHCLVVGKNALHVATQRPADGTTKVTVKTVYWDAIGHALVEIDDNGLERVDIYGREGSLVESITSPTTISADIDARGLADLVNKRIAAARKAA
jgi:hypothetical protein